MEPKKTWSELTDEEKDQMTEEDASEAMLADLIDPETGTVEIGE